MSEYRYLSSSKSSRRAVRRMIGMQIFYYRHQYNMRAEELCTRAGITRQALDNVELGKGGMKAAPKWCVIDRILQALDLRLEVKLCKAK